MIIYSTKSLVTYSSSETLDLVNVPNISDKNLYNDYYNFINAVSLIYGTQKEDGTIPVFWTKIKNTATLEREADSNSTLKKLEPNNSYYIVLLDKTKLPLKIPQPLDKTYFLDSIEETIENEEPCYIEQCKNTISIITNNHRNISLNSGTGYSTNIHIPIAGLIPDKNYTFIIEPINSNWPNKLSKTSGTIVRNNPLDQYGYISSSIDSKFMYLYIDGINDLNNSLPYELIDISKDNHNQNIFSLFQLKIYEDNILINIDTINILCDSCVPTQTPFPTPTPTPTKTIPVTPSVTPTIGSSPTPTPTTTPTETPYEANRKCPRLNIIEKNIVLTNNNSVEIVAEFSYIDPNRNYGYEFINNGSNWPALLTPLSDKITNYSLYKEDNITYGSGLIKSTLILNKDSESFFNLNATIPEYVNETFFRKNIYLNLELNLSRQKNIDEIYDDIILYSDSCGIAKDNLNIICDNCVDTNKEIFDCTESVSVAINNSNLNYQILSLSNRPSSEITLEESCCDKINNVYANISGLCESSLYKYEWSSYPPVSINPPTGFLSVGSKNTKIHTTFRLKE